MSLTTHWRRPFEQLLLGLQQQYGGEIIQHSDEISSTGGGALYFGPPLPTMRFTADGTRFFIDMSNEYQLHIYAIGHTQADFKVYPRGFVERVQSLFGTGDGVSSHNPHFDRAFATNTDAKDPGELIRKGEVQLLIESLAPFVFVRFHAGGIHFAHDIGPESDLDASVVGKAITTLAHLLAVVS